MRTDQFTDSDRYQLLSSAQVIPDQPRCVQCGICTYHCPIGIDVRRYAWRGEAIIDSHCLTCGECINRCPRGVLRFGHTNIAVESN